MAAVNLDKLHFNDAESPSDHTAVSEYEKLMDSETELVYLARNVASDVFGWLEAHAGKTVCIRDPEGGKVFGVLGTVSRPDPTESGSEIRISARKVDFSEGV